MRKPPEGRPTTVDQSRGRSSGLDALRAFASIFVVLFHIRIYSAFTFGLFDRFVLGGDTGVWMFFALSGYLLYKPFLKRPVDLRAFALLRAARIVPGYYVALACLFLLTGSQLFIDHPLPYLTGTFTYNLPLRSFFGNAWTLSAEVLFYLTLPLLARAARGREVVVLSALALASIALAVVERALVPDRTDWVFGSYPLVFFAFVPGMLLAVIEVRHPRSFAHLARWPYLVLGLAALAMGSVSTDLPIPVGTLLGTPLVMGWLIHHRVPGARYLAFAGGASYALYLWHKDLFIAFGPIGLVIAFAGAGLSWALVERPILAKAHAIAAGWKADPVASAGLRCRPG